MITGALIAVAGLAWLIALRARFSAATVLLFALSLRVVLLLVPFHSDDVYRYVWEGRIQNAGFSPFAYAPDDERLAGLRRGSHENINHPDLPTIYPPLAQALFRTATAAGLEELGMAKLLMVLEMGVVLLLFLWLRSPAVMVYAWAPLAMAGPVGGHVDPLMLLFLVGCAWAWERRRFHAAAALLGCAVLSKAIALVLLPWLLVRKPRVGLTALIVIAVGYLPYGFSLGSLVTFASEFRFNGSMHHLFGNFSLVLLAAWIAWVTLTQPRLPAAAALIFAGLLLLSPTVHFWYLSWFLVFLPAVTARWREPLLLWSEARDECLDCLEPSRILGMSYVTLGTAAISVDPRYVPSDLRTWCRITTATSKSRAIRTIGRMTVAHAASSPLFGPSPCVTRAYSVRLSITTMSAGHSLRRVRIRSYSSASEWRIS